MPTIFIDRGDIQITVHFMSVSSSVDYIRCRVVLVHHGLEIVLQDERIIYIVQGVYSLTAPPEN